VALRQVAFEIDAGPETAAPLATHVDRREAPIWRRGVVEMEPVGCVDPRHRRQLGRPGQLGKRCEAVFAIFAVEIDDRQAAALRQFPETDRA